MLTLKMFAEITKKNSYLFFLFFKALKGSKLRQIFIAKISTNEMRRFGEIILIYIHHTTAIYLYAIIQGTFMSD